MTPEALFTLCNTAVLPAWLLLAVAPGWKWTQHLVHSAWIPLALGSVYATLLATSGDAPEGAGFGSLEGVMLIFSDPRAALAGWIHYLVFDLFVGAWEVRDARRLGLAHWTVVPCLALTLMLGPLGLVTYLALRALRDRRVTLLETEAA